MPPFVVRKPFHHILECKLQHAFDRYGHTGVNIFNIFHPTQKQTFPKERIPMNKIGLIKTLSTTTDIPKIEAAKIVNLFFDKLAGALEKGDRVEIRGLFSFYAREYEGYTGRNPKTGETVEIAPNKLTFFKCGKGLRERVDTEHQD